MSSWGLCLGLTVQAVRVWDPLQSLPSPGSLSEEGTPAELLGKDYEGRGVGRVEPGLPLAPLASAQGPQLWALGKRHSSLGLAHSHWVPEATGAKV